MLEHQLNTLKGSQRRHSTLRIRQDGCTDKARKCRKHPKHPHTNTPTHTHTHSGINEASATAGRQKAFSDSFFRHLLHSLLFLSFSHFRSLSICRFVVSFSFISSNCVSFWTAALSLSLSLFLSLPLSFSLSLPFSFTHGVPFDILRTSVGDILLRQQARRASK